MYECKPKGVTVGLGVALEPHLCHGNQGPGCLLSGSGSRKLIMYEWVPKDVTVGLGAASKPHQSQGNQGPGCLLSGWGSRKVQMVV